MQRITSSSDQVALNTATQVNARWGTYEVNWSSSIKDAYASSQNVFGSIARVALEVFANIAKTVANLAIGLGNKVYNLLHPQAPASAPAPAVIQDMQQQVATPDLADGEVTVSSSVSISYEQDAPELDAAETEAVVASVVIEEPALEEELPDLDVEIEPLPELRIANNNWKKSHIAAGAALGTAVAATAVVYGLKAAGVNGPYDFCANNAAYAWQGMQNAGSSFADGAKTAAGTAWSWTGEPIGEAAKTAWSWTGEPIGNAAYSAYSYVSSFFGNGYGGNNP